VILKSGRYLFVVRAELEIPVAAAVNRQRVQGGHDAIAIVGAPP
jgi:hypothetical protein